MKMRNTLIGFALGCAAAMLMPMPAGAEQTQANAPQSMQMNGHHNQRMQLHDAMRKLWEDHVSWTRLYIVSAVGNLPDKDATTKRLLKNQEDLGNAIKPYFGDDAGTKLTALLRDHILLAAKLVDVAKVNDSVKVADAKKQWYANADDIAGFLSNANPDNWPISATKPMMHDHLDLTLQEATAQIQGRFGDAIAAYDKIMDQALMMGDTLSSGIIKRFPDKFGERMARPEAPVR